MTKGKLKKHSMMDFEGYTAYQFSNVFESINKHFLMWKLKSSSYIKLILDYTYISPEYWWTTFIWTASTNGVQICWTMNGTAHLFWNERINERRSNFLQWTWTRTWKTKIGERPILCWLVRMRSGFFETFPYELGTILLNFFDFPRNYSGVFRNFWSVLAIE